MSNLKSILFFLLPFTAISQTITGKIYDNDASVKGAKIQNINKDEITYTDNTGSFKLQASVNDTLIISSLFHHEQTINVNKSHFENTIVIELKKIVNTLDEVLLHDKPKAFNAETYTKKFNNVLKEDIKNNPHLYEPPPSGNLDFVKIVELLVKMIRKKKDKKTPVIKTTITYNQLDSLFTHDTYFNNELLKSNLKIPETYKTLFFDYCDAQQLDSKILLKENDFLLLSELYTYSEAFLKQISEFGDVQKD